MKELEIEAVLDRLDDVIGFVDTELEAADCCAKKQMQIDLAVEEIFVNIVHYAYSPGTGPATIRFAVSPDGSAVSITFIDNGIPYNPLQKEDPDLTLSTEERAVGGLGIFLVKKNTDDLFYEYVNGQNVLTLTKKL